MPNGFTAKQTLGFVEEKLRRVFNLAGPIGASLDPEVKPVIIVDDLRAPGHAFAQGRSFVAQFGTTGIAAGRKGCGFRFTADVFIEGWWAYGPAIPGATGVLFVAVITPDEVTATPPMLMNVACGAWRDRKLITADQPPCLSSLNFVAITGTSAATNNAVFTASGAGTPLPGFVPMNVMVPSGGAILFDETDLVSLNVGLQCRLWPQ